MLEFEETAKKLETTMPDGFVMLPVSEYNRLLLAANKPWPMQVRLSNWMVGKAVEVDFDERAIYKWAISQMESAFDPEELKDLQIRPLDKVYMGGMVIAERPREDQE